MSKAPWDPYSEQMESLERAEDAEMLKHAHGVVRGILARDGDRRKAAKALLELVHSERLHGNLAVQVAMYYGLADELQAISLRGG